MNISRFSPLAIAFALALAGTACKSDTVAEREPSSNPTTATSPETTMNNEPEAPEPSPPDENPKVVVGETDEQTMMQEFPAFRAILDAGKVNQDAAMTIAGASDVSIDIYLGTWCGDSKRELAQWLAARNAADSEKGPKVRYVAVDRGMSAGDVELPDDLTNVPTFYVYRDGKELGRVVETAVESIEVDVADLISGKRLGFISATVEAPAE
jgi:hypothetical protein